MSSLRSRWKNAAGAVLAASLILATASVSEANDPPQFHHSGSMCFQYGSAGTSAIYNQGIIMNNSYSQTMSVYCPVVRENGASETGRMTVYLADRNHGKGIRCSWYDVCPDGQSWWWSNNKTSGGGGYNNFGNLGWNRETVHDRYAGYSHLRCTIPPRTSDGVSYISSYRTGGD